MVTLHLERAVDLWRYILHISALKQWAHTRAAFFKKKKRKTSAFKTSSLDTKLGIPVTKESKKNCTQEQLEEGAQSVSERTLHHSLKNQHGLRLERSHGRPTHRCLFVFFT
jgi:hypothetical protein